MNEKIILFLIIFSLINIVYAENKRQVKTIPINIINMKTGKTMYSICEGNNCPPHGNIPKNIKGYIGSPIFDIGFYVIMGSLFLIYKWIKNKNDCIGGSTWINS